MLFETIYGPDAESIYFFVNQKEKNVSINKIYEAFVPKNSKGELERTKNVEDAVAFLKSAGLIEGEKVFCSTPLPFEDFRLSLIYSLRKIETDQDYKVEDELDRYYLRIITDLFVEKNNFYLKLDEIHKLANMIKGVPKGIGINKTKINAWKRVMEFLGLGFRDTTGGFYCVYSDEIIRSIIYSWSERDGIIQNLMENHFGKFLPWKDNQGKMSQIVQQSFLRLARQNVIRLLPAQDLSAVAYFPQNYRCIELI